LFNDLNPKQANLNLIKEPSDNLFAFNELGLNFTFDSIQPDAKFLFGQLTCFKLSSLTTTDSLINMINEFKSATNSITNIADDDDTFDREQLPCSKFYNVTCLNNRVITSLSMRDEDATSIGQWPSIKELRVFCDRDLARDLKLFKMFPNLEKLEIDSFRFRVGIYDMLTGLEYCESLKSLKIQLNSIDCFQTLARCFPQLEELDLYGSRCIGIIGPNTFVNFPNLKKLSLKDCSIRSIDPGAFNHLLNLDELDLDDNSGLTALHMKGPVVPRVLKASDCKNLATVKLLDFDSHPSCTIEKLLLPWGSEVETTLEGPPRLFAHTRELKFTPTVDMSFAPFIGLKRLSVAIGALNDVKLLASLVSLKELFLYCYYLDDDDGELFRIFNCKNIILTIIGIRLYI
jgi:Leucine-rich repeat (LRR) protein